MLCPRCGVEVGEQPTLCPSCAAAEEEQARTEIGRISVKKIAVSVTPDERRAIERQRQDYYEGKVVRDTETIIEEFNTSRRSRTGWLIFLLCGAGLLAWGSVWLIGSNVTLETLLPRTEEKSSPEDVSAPDFSHIRVPENPVVNEAAEGAVARLTVNGKTMFFHQAVARYRPEENRVEVQFSPKAPEPQKDTAFSVSFLLQPGSTEFSLNTLRSYVVEVFFENERLQFVRTYSRRLTPFGEIAGLSGQLAPGNYVRASLNDERIERANDRVFQVAWNMTISAELVSAD